MSTKKKKTFMFCEDKKNCASSSDLDTNLNKTFLKMFLKKKFVKSHASDGVGLAKKKIRHVSSPQKFDKVFKKLFEKLF